MQQTSRPLISFFNKKPSSFDPHKYDLFIHHFSQTSVLAPLISNYASKQYFPLLAQSWESQNNYTKWTFTIKKNITFSNNKTISPIDIANSFKRIALLQKNNNSEGNWTNLLLGFEKLSSMESALPGIITNKNKLTLLFSQPIEDLLDKISFGIYAIVSPDDYNPITGIWNDHMKVTSSYQYKLHYFW